jgi:DNA repair exonuclease SbcCD ATPase subunit
MVVLVSSAALAQSTLQGRPAAVSVAMTDTAEAKTTTAERRVAQLAAQRSVLAKRYQDELDAIDRLKKQRASWRRDRDLRDSLSSSLETANQLTSTTRELDEAQQTLATARRAYLAAIDSELGSAPVAARRANLEHARRQLTPQLADAPRRIVLPDLDIDPLADPEELDQRAAELRATEDELSRQATGLSAQAKELEHLAQLRKQHERAGDLFSRDDDQPQRGAVRKSSETVDDPVGLDSPHSPAVPSGGSASSFESFVPVVLAEVIDASTIDTFAAAERSGDPLQRAEAAHKAHDAVARRIDQVRKKRSEIEARARQLRLAP